MDWPMDPRGLALLSAVPQAATIAIAFVALRQEPAPATRA
jgi:hypothetical protein